MNKYICKCKCCTKANIRNSLDIFSQSPIKMSRHLINIVNQYIDYTPLHLSELQEITKFLHTELQEIICYHNRVINCHVNEFTDRQELRNFYNKTKIIKEDKNWIILYYV